MTDPFATYDNRTGRPPGRIVRLLSRIVPGVAAVRDQSDPYADDWTARNRAALAGPVTGRRWIVLGDSMMLGVGASSLDAGLVGSARRATAARGYPLTVVNLSANGARVRDVVEQQVPVMQALPGPDPAAGPDLVTVLVGSNDLFGGREHSAALPEQMHRLVDLLPHDAVICTLPQPRDAARRANAHLDRAAEEGRLRLVDLRVTGPKSWKGKLASDWFHPNDAGYAAMADAIEPVLLETLADQASED